MNKYFWLKEFEIYRYKNLVYLRTFKCGSSYYLKIFNNAGWSKSSADNIDWDQDHVFSFIMDPYERRLKGLTEFIFSYKQQALLDFEKDFWGNVLYLDVHSMPYNISYGKYIDRIDWIPIDCQNFAPDLAKNMLSSLLSWHNTHCEFLPNREHKSTQEKLKIYETVKTKTEQGNFAMHLGLEDDVDLYRRVCAGISPGCLNNPEKTWKDVSWLKQQT